MSLKTLSFENLEILRELGCRVTDRSHGVHSNPRFCKYVWWIFWRGSACQGDEFLTPPYRLSTKKAFDLMDELDRNDEAYWIYNNRLPRHGSPMDPTSLKWKDHEWAPSYDEDLDEEIFGHR